MIGNTRSLVIAVVGALYLSFGLVGNLLVVIAVWKKRSLRSTTNYLLVNLAVSDLISLAFLPLMLIEPNVRIEEGFLADFLCKFTTYHVPLTASFASILTLVVLSTERYHAVVKPMKSGLRLKEETVYYAIIFVWIIAICLTLPYYIFGYWSKKCRYDSSEDKIKIYVLVVMSIIVITPFFIISFCYLQIVRELYLKAKQVGPQNVELAEDNLVKRKLVKLSLCVTLAYVVCFFPMAIALFLHAYDRKKYNSSHYRNACILYFLESVVNPIVYATQSSNFRQAFKELLRCRR